MSLLRLVCIALVVVLATAVAAYLASFAAHTWLLLGYPYPLDYGEGPLLTQITLLHTGVPFWRIYADPAAPPYVVVNYPPFYLLVTQALSTLTGSTLLAGRLVSLGAALGCVPALFLLMRAGRTAWPFALLVAVYWLTVPIVREWAVLMRVDMLGVCLGLWGLVLVQTGCGGAQPRHGAPLWLSSASAGLLLVLSLYTKPSLLAAPVAACAWLTWCSLRGSPDQRWAARRTLVVVLGVLALGGAGLLLLELASGSWFLHHVVTANANRWEAALAWGFWLAQAQLRWPLLVAALLVGFAAWRWRSTAKPTLPLFYAVLGVATAVGVGKVGAYSNYFLELYAGLVWLAGSQRVGGRQGDKETGRQGDETRECGQHKHLAVHQPNSQPNAARSRSLGLPKGTQHSLLSTLAALCLLLSLVRYPPLWSTTSLRPAGLVEPNPSRLAFGRYGLWRDVEREAAVLAAQGRINAALVAEVQAAGDRVFTDMPGLAAAAGTGSRWQVFEHRQLLDQAAVDQRGLLAELANGELPLVVLDFLGNWLSPEMVQVIQHRYAQDGALGTFDRYRPVAIGPRTPLSMSFDDNALQLTGLHRVPAFAAAYEPGETLLTTLEWHAAPGAPTSAPTIVVQLIVPDGTPVAESTRPLVYGALAPADWPTGQALQHVQPLVLPDDLAAGVYQLAVLLENDAANRTAPRVIDMITVGTGNGRRFSETGYFVPTVFLAVWDDIGGRDRAGFPLTPVVPFAWGRLQCFERICLELHDGGVQQRPLGNELYLAETARADACQPVASGLCADFRDAPQQYAQLGDAISGDIDRDGLVVQWTEYARLERFPQQAAVSLGHLGAETLRLPPGEQYRWP